MNRVNEDRIKNLSISDLTGDVINIQSRPEQFESDGEKIAYKIGHRDARHGILDVYQDDPNNIENMSIDESNISGFSEVNKKAYIFGFNEAKKEAISIISQKVD